MGEDGRLTELVERFGGRVDEHDGRPRWWVTDPDADAYDAATAVGLTVTRRIHQMRRPLPITDVDIAPTRAFDPERDVDQWLAINNAAFSWHPDQGNWTRSMLERRMAEPWFDLDGFRVAELDGQMAGFCWTKVHPDDDSPLGEIFVIAIDPDLRGTGLGSALTAAGLDWLWTERHTPIGMLYVESDNTPALTTYRRLGFDVVSTDTAFEPLDTAVEPA